ncbi:MAG: histidine kinase [Spirochaetes bacterium GWD1_27_9]|nr:MAG: histidine kinase [Spirochaetes bacterium GWB1_27_13]OHD27837.1 MAG: histidine kinase [Spirochaetes bacterium GWC1_27_15]OHD30849.1 MAG: histidine kinase [Spirochaetes bacterium GWD1_27_9]
MENSIKFLLVEDEVINAMLMKMQLEKTGYKVTHHVTTGENAIISSKQNPPDIILMDIRLAGEIDGIEAAEIIKSQSNIPIIFITGYDDLTIRKRAEKLNPLEYLIKPLVIDKLKTIIDAYFIKPDNIFCG